MNGRSTSIVALTLALATGIPVASQGQSAPSAPRIHWEVDGPGTTSAVAVLGIPPTTLKALSESEKSFEQWSNLFSIRLEKPGSLPLDRPAMLGTYEVEGAVLRFKPRYSFDRGRTYLATFRPAQIPGGPNAEVVSRQTIEKLRRPATIVNCVAPSSGQLPENLLKFYLYFSSPMSRGEVYDRVRLLKANGQAVESPFLRLAEELWDPTGTRLTLLIDPGRIKQGLRPREEHGPVFKAGQTYTLVIDAAWPDSEGDPLGAEFRKTFRAGAVDDIQPDPKTWTIGHPRPSTREPLEIRFPESLDRALLDSALTLLDPNGREVAGHLEIDNDETRWRFTPEAPWSSGEYALQVDTELEDLAGNSIRRPFEVDVQRDTPLKAEARFLRLRIPTRVSTR